MRLWRRPAAIHLGRWWALDLETTGLDPDRARVLAIGMVPVVDGVIRLDGSIATRIHPGAGVRPAEPSIASTNEDESATQLAVHGIEAHHLRPRDVADAPSLSEVLPGVMARLAAADGLLVHHAPLDMRVLRRACTEIRIDLPRVRVVDTLTLVRRANRRRTAIGAEPLPTDLAGARAALGLPPHRMHDALADAVATAELALVLLA